MYVLMACSGLARIRAGRNLWTLLHAWNAGHASNCPVDAIKVNSGVGCAFAMMWSAITGSDEVSCDRGGCCKPGSESGVELLQIGKKEDKMKAEDLEKVRNEIRAKYKNGIKIVKDGNESGCNCGCGENDDDSCCGC